MKLVVAGGRARAEFCAAPSLVVAREVFLAAIRIGEVAGDHDSPGDLVEQFGSGLGAGEILAVRDVACADEDCALIAGRNRLRDWRDAARRRIMIRGEESPR